jgi:CHAT domain-containing protein/tetratricopeptide (TPR) repeat protein
MQRAGAEAARARAAAAASGDSELIALAQVLFARYLHETGGDLDRAALLLQQAATAITPDSPYDLRRDLLLFQGDIALELGRRGEAGAAYRRMLALTLAEEDIYAAATARYGLAQVAFEEMTESPRESAVRETRELAGQALDLAIAAQHTGTEAHARHILGMLLSGPEGAEHLERCLAVAPTERIRSYCLQALTRHLAPHDPAAAQATLERAFALAGGTDDPWSLTLCWRERMHLAWVGRPPAQAYGEGLAALAVIEALRDVQRSESGRAELFSTWVEDYHWLSGRLLAAGTASGDRELVAQAFGVTERMRARTLLETVAAAAANHRSAPAPPDAGVDWSPARRLSRRGFATLRDVQRALAANEALLSFQVAPWRDAAGRFAGGAWLLVVTRDRPRVHRLAGRVELRSQIAMFDGLIPRRDGEEAQPAAALHRRLLARALAELPRSVERLILVPDDDLHRLPFAALRATPAGPPLGRRYQLTVVPSATLWLLWRERPAAAAPRPALALADPPAPGAGEPPWRGAAPAERGASFAPARRLPPLPHARREGRAVVHHLGRGSVLRVGEEASEDYLKRGGGRFGLLHFATHALLDDELAERSAVLLAPGAATEDGLLQVREIAELDLTGATVVLASCRSASGQVLRGEGVMGLARAFFQAGAQAVVASLWPLRDDDSAVLFASFYRHLGAGRTLAAALRAAQAERIAAGAPAAAWAGLVVLGDGELAPGRVPGRAPWRRRAAAAGALALLAAAVGAALALLARRRV